MAAKAPAIKNYVRGDSCTINVQIYQSDNVTPQNLTGCKVYLTINSSSRPSSDVTDSTAKVRKSVSTFTDPTSGIATIVLTNADTQLLNAGTYYYDVQVVDASGNVSSLQANKFTVVDDITTRVT